MVKQGAVHFILDFQNSSRQPCYALEYNSNVILLLVNDNKDF